MREPARSSRLLAGLRGLRDSLADRIASAGPRPDWGSPARWELEDTLARLRVLAEG